MHSAHQAFPAKQRIAPAPGTAFTSVQREAFESAAAEPVQVQRCNAGRPGTRTELDIFPGKRGRLKKADAYAQQLQAPEEGP